MSANKISQEISLDFDDVLIEPQRSSLSSRSVANLERTFNFLYSTRTLTCVPIMCANMSFSSFSMAKELSKHKIITCLHKYHSVEALKEYFVDNSIDYTWISIGYKKSDLSKLVEFKNQTNIQPNICIDVPNGHMDVFVKYCKKVRDEFPESIIMAGNITNTSSCQELLTYGGVDISKVGIGGGSACLSRFVTGCGVPQLTACLENSHVAHGLDNGSKKLGLICSDGGHKTPGDVCKAFVGGADFVMLGGYFAGTDCCDGDWQYKYKCGTEALPFWQSFDPGYDTIKEKTQFTYYGMSSHHAQQTFEENQKDYRASEGTKITVNYKGTTEQIVKELLGGIRSCCSYIGAKNIKNMVRCGTFRRVNNIHRNQNPVFGL